MSASSHELTAKLGIIDLIERTHKFITWTDLWKHVFAGRHETDEGDLYGWATAYEDAQNEAFLAINDALQRVGGLPMKIDATAQMPELELTAWTWLGLDPSNQNNHKWVAGSGALMTETTVDSAECLAEMREKLLKDLQP
jgi:hypothetical protein